MKRVIKLKLRKFYRRYATDIMILALAALSYGMMFSSTLNSVVAGAFSVITCVILIVGVGYKILSQVKKPSSEISHDASSSRDER